jgi:hypothetical protein
VSVICCLDIISALSKEYREGQINALDRVQQKAVKFANHTTDSNWETLAQRRKTARLCALFKAYTGERAWKATVTDYKVHTI